ncbi:MAG: ABC transporter ATP-binding protein [Alkalispirochaeta sp.]
MTTPLLELDDVSRTFRVRNPAAIFGGKRTLTAVDGVSLRVDAGTTLGLVGESGCGKSTLGNIIAGHLRPDAGSVLFEGKPLSPVRDPETTRSIQMVFQDPAGALDPRWPVLEQIREPLEIFGDGTGRSRKRKAREYMELVGLSRDYEDSYPHQLSGGQRQRVVTARALVLEPKLLVCDEPVSALDVSIQAQVLNLLMQLQRELRYTYLFITHDLRVVRHIAGETAVMYMGRIVERAPTDTLFADPIHPYTKALLSAVPQPDPTARKERIVLQGDPPSPLALPPGCRFSSRCPYVIDRCTRAEPPPYTLSAGRQVACYRAEEL